MSRITLSISILLGLLMFANVNANPAISKQHDQQITGSLVMVGGALRDSSNNIDINILSYGDTFSPLNKTFISHHHKVSTLGHELFDLKAPLVTGVLNRNSQLKDFVDILMA